MEENIKLDIMENNIIKNKNEPNETWKPCNPVVK